MKKKVLIILVALTVIGLAVYFYLKSKKKAQTQPANSLVASVNNATASALANTPASSVTSQPSPVIAKPVVTTPTSPIVQAPFSSSNTPAPIAQTSTEYNFVNVIRDGSRGMAIIQFQPVTRAFSVGESVRILSGPYAGVHKIWYIYRGTQDNAPVHNLYLETTFKTEGQRVPGKFYQA